MKRIVYLLLLSGSILYGQTVTDSLFVKSIRAKKGNTVVEFKHRIKLSDGTYLPASTAPQVSISLSGTSSQLEYMSAGADLSVNLNYSVTRPTNCGAISSITVAGQPIAVQNPFNVGSTQSGTLTGRSLVRNTNTTYTISVISEVNNSASINVVWYWRKYWGTIASNSAPSDAQIIALSSEPSTTRVKSYDGINGNGQYLIFAFPSAWGVPVFKVYGLTNSAFTKVRDNAFVNASGGSTTYQVWISNTVYNGIVSDFDIQ